MKAKLETVDILKACSINMASGDYPMDVTVAAYNPFGRFIEGITFTHPHGMGY